METQSGASMEALLSPDEAAALLGISRRTLETWVRSNKVPFVKLGRLTKFRSQALRQWIEAQERQIVPNSEPQQKTTRPFYETATAEEWNKAFLEWAESHRSLPRLLSGHSLKVRSSRVRRTLGRRPLRRVFSTPEIYEH